MPFASVYFAGASWGCAFYIGVIRSLEARFGADWGRRCVVTSDSAGALIALGVALGKTTQELEEMYQYLSRVAAGGGVIGLMSRYHDEVLSSWLDPCPDAYKTIQGRYACGTTTILGSHQWHSSWASNDDLKTCMHGSFHIPYYCTYTKPVGGRMVVGGAVSTTHETSLLDHTETLWISVDCETADIAMEPPMSNAQCVLPILGDELARVQEAGAEAANEWCGGVQQKKLKTRPLAMVLVWILRLAEAAQGTHFLPGMGSKESEGGRVLGRTVWVNKWKVVRNVVWMVVIGMVMRRVRRYGMRSFLELLPIRLI